jgi:hypothetical protein
MWSQEFTIDTDQVVTVTFDYNLEPGRKSEDEAAEELQLYVNVGGGGETLVDTVRGNGNGDLNPPSVSGSYSNQFSLTAGTHSMDLIGFLSSKNADGEEFFVELDNVVVEIAVDSNRLPNRYELQRSDDGETGWTTLITNVAYATPAAYLDGGLACGQEEFFYRARAWYDPETLGSAWSNIDPGTTGDCPVLASPTSLVATGVDSSTVQVDWTHPGTPTVSLNVINGTFAGGSTDGFSFSAVSGNTYTGEVGGSGHDSTIGSGSLKVKLGGNVSGPSRGEWRRTISLDAEQEVSFSFRYRAFADGSAEATEYIQVGFQIDDNPEVFLPLKSLARRLTSWMVTPPVNTL